MIVPTGGATRASWPRPAKATRGGDEDRRFGVSARQARRIVKVIGTASVTNTTVIDPIGIIEAAVLR